MERHHQGKAVYDHLRELGAGKLVHSVGIMKAMPWLSQGGISGAVHRMLGLGILQAVEWNEDHLETYYREFPEKVNTAYKRPVLYKITGLVQLKIPRFSESVDRRGTTRAKKYSRTPRRIELPEHVIELDPIKESELRADPLLEELLATVRNVEGELVRRVDKTLKALADLEDCQTQVASLKTNILNFARLKSKKVDLSRVHEKDLWEQIQIRRKAGVKSDEQLGLGPKVISLSARAAKKGA